MDKKKISVEFDLEKNYRAVKRRSVQRGYITISSSYSQ